MILQVIQQIFCEMLIGEIKMVNTESIFWGHQYQEGCPKWFFRVLWVTPQNGAKDTIHQPRYKL